MQYQLQLSVEREEEARAEAEAEEAAAQQLEERCDVKGEGGEGGAGLLAGVQESMVFVDQRVCSGAGWGGGIWGAGTLPARRQAMQVLGRNSTS